VRVSGLSYDAQNADIESFFNTFCEVKSVNLLTDRNTGRSKGMCFVKLASQDSLDKAVANNRCEHMGRYLNIEQAQGRQQRQQFNAGATNGGNSHLAGVATTLFVGNLSFKTVEAGLEKAFAQIGGVTGVRIAKDQEGYSRGFGHIDFDSPDSAQKALAMAGTPVDGREIRCDLSQPKTGGAGGFGGNRGGAPRGGRGGFRGGNG